LLNADYREDVTRPFIKPMTEVAPQQLSEQFESLENEARDWLNSQKMGGSRLTIERYAEMRYLGQEHTIRIPVHDEDFANPDFSHLRQRFNDHYEKAYAHALPEHDLEFVILRLVAKGEIAKPPLFEIQKSGMQEDIVSIRKRDIYVADAKRSFACDLYDRESVSRDSVIDGPVVIEEWSTTILILPGQQVTSDKFGNLVIDEKN